MLILDIRDKDRRIPSSSMQSGQIDVCSDWAAAWSGTAIARCGPSGVTRNRIVDQHACHQRERQQRQRAQVEPQQVHEPEGWDGRKRDGDRRNQRSAPVPQEEKDEVLALPQWRQNCRRAADKPVQTSRNAEPSDF